MPVSVYFNNQGATREQILVEDLIIESIRNHGIDIYYIPRDSQSEFDRLFGDDPVKYYSRAYKIDMYMETFNDFGGQQEFFSKFGLNIDKTARVAVARRTFQKLVPTVIRDVPKDGDLIFLPTQNKLMEIKFVEEEENFFQLGRAKGDRVSNRNMPYMYSLSLETFKYNGELLNTGIQDIDFLADDITNSVVYTVHEDGQPVSFQRGEIVYQTQPYENATAYAIVAAFDRVTLELRLRNIKGLFVDAPIYGLSSGASFNLDNNYDDKQNATTDLEDNSYLESQATDILDFSETNPFGEP
jgi:hypothetical protein